MAQFGFINHSFQCDPCQLILSLEKRLIEVNETLKKFRESFLEKTADLDALQRKTDDQVR